MLKQVILYLKQKSVTTITLPKCKLILSKLTLCVDNDNAALTPCHFHEYFPEVNLDVPQTNIDDIFLLAQF